MEDSFWFMAFQCEEELDEVESYITPWIGAKVTEVGEKHTLYCKIMLGRQTRAIRGNKLARKKCNLFGRTEPPYYLLYGKLKIEFHENLSENLNMLDHKIIKMAMIYSYYLYQNMVIYRKKCCCLLNHSFCM